MKSLTTAPSGILVPCEESINGLGGALKGRCGDRANLPNQAMQRTGLRPIADPPNR